MNWLPWPFAPAAWMGVRARESSAILSKPAPPVVIASKTYEGIAKAAKLAVVPYGQGELILHRAASKLPKPSVIEHYFGGDSKASRLEIRDGTLRLALREQDEKGCRSSGLK